LNLSGRQIHLFGRLKQAKAINLMLRAWFMLDLFKPSSLRLLTHGDQREVLLLLALLVSQRCPAGCPAPGLPKMA